MHDAGTAGSRTDDCVETAAGSPHPPVPLRRQLSAHKVMIWKGKM